MTDDLIIRYITGQADQFEEKLVHEWISQDESHQRDLVRLKNAWVLSGLGQETDEARKNQEIQAILKRIRTGQKRSISIPVYLRNAAAVLLIAATSGIAGYFFSRVKLAPETYTEIVVPRGERSKVILSDGTTVKLNGDSRLRFPSAFDGKTREVELEGEAYFNVAHNEKMPFVVKASDFQVEVLGTRFNVNCYSNEQDFTTFLESGRVKISSPENHIDNIVLKPSESLEFDRITGKYLKLTIPDSRMTDWTKGILTVKGETIEELAKKLERRFNIRIVFGDDAVKKHTYTGSIKDEELKTILDALQFASSLNYEITGNIVTLSSSGKK